MNQAHIAQAMMTGDNCNLGVMLSNLPLDRAGSLAVTVLPVRKTEYCLVLEVSMDYQDYVGFYHMIGFQLKVLEVEGQLVGAVPDVPAGFEIYLEPVSPEAGWGDRFHMRGGPLDGATVEFLRGEAGNVRAARVEQYELTRLSPEQAAELSMVKRLIAAPLVLTPEKQAVFQSLLDETLSRSDGGAVD